MFKNKLVLRTFHMYICISVYCLCVNVYYTTASSCQRNCSWQIYVYIHIFTYIFIYIYIYLSTAIALTAGGSSIVHIYTQTIHRCAYIRMKCSQDKFVLKFGSHNILTIKIYFFPPPMKYHKWTLTNVIWKQHLLFAI